MHASETAPDPFIGSRLGRHFVVEDRIAGGAMGMVYRGRNVLLDQPVAIKVVPAVRMTDPAVRGRFQQEALAMGQLRQPNLARVLDFGQSDDGSAWLAMEYVDGRTISRILADEGPLAPGRALAIARQICLALDEAHANGVVHRDLKADNVLVQRKPDGECVKVVDFGVAKLTDRWMGDGPRYRTSLGTVCGTPEYMAPEQAMGGQVDARTDLYSLGILLYQMLCGAVPFEGTNALDVVTAHVRRPPPPLRERAADLDPGTEALVMDLLAKSPGDRPGAALEVCDRIDALLGHARAPARAHRVTPPPSEEPRVLPPPDPAMAPATQPPSGEPDAVRVAPPEAAEEGLATPTRVMPAVGPATEPALSFAPAWRARRWAVIAAVVLLLGAATSGAFAAVL